MPQSPDPYNRCQRTGTFGQCPEEKVPGTDYCASHGGRATAAKGRKRMYDLAQAEFKGIYGLMADREDVLSLRDEVALIRAAIQKITNLMGQSDANFESKINTFNTLLLTAKALVADCLKVEEKAGITVERAALLNFAGEAVQICSEELAGAEGSQEILERIASRLIDAVKSAGVTADATM